MGNEVNEPVLGIAMCAWTGCMFRWRILLPDGCENKDAWRYEL